MSKKRGESGKDADRQGAPASTTKTTTKVRQELMRRAKTVASFRDIDLFDYIDGILTEAVDRDYYRIVRGDQEGGK